MRKNSILRLSSSVSLSILMAGCASYPALSTKAVEKTPTTDEQPFETAGGAERPDSGSERRPNVTTLKSPSPNNNPVLSPADFAPTTIKATPEQIAALVTDEEIDGEVALTPQVLPVFIDTVFGVLLDIPYSMGPGIADQREIVSLRGSMQMSKIAFFTQVQLALEDYGLVTTIENGAVRILQSSALASEAPIFIKSRAFPSVPESSRPVVQFFELQSILVNSIIEVLKDAYPDDTAVKFTPDPGTNTLLIRGNPKDVAEAARLVERIDVPRLAGAQVARIEPVFWPAEDMASTLIQILSTEGYQAINASGIVQRAVNILTLPNINQFLIFSTQPEAYQRALYWVNELDQPSSIGDTETVFIYRVRNTDASELGELISKIPLVAASTTPGATPVAPIPTPTANTNGALGATGTSGSGPFVGGGRITVDIAGNRLLFFGTASEFQRIQQLLRQLDTPPSQILIEVTVAEVTLTDDSQFGIEYQLRQAIDNGLAVFGTTGGLGIGGGGFNFDFTGDDLLVALNALATNQKVNVLSTPRLVARSGGAASIQVGTDVPVITSQRATEFNQGGAGTDVLQSVTYRQTGVLLNVEPIVYGDDRIDLTVTQEVSSTTTSATPGIASPTISNRSIDTQISLREGQTAVLGGLMQDNYTRNVTGIPFLKDIPGVGTLFKSTNANTTKTELLIFVTPYILRSDDQIESATRRYMDSINNSLAVSRGSAYTLNPFDNELGTPSSVVHGGSLE